MPDSPDLPIVHKDADISALVERLRPVLLRLGRRLRHQADQIGLSSLDAALLSMVAKHDGIGVSELADKEHTSRPTMSNHVKRLEAAGLLARLEADEADRRRVALVVTPKGFEAIDVVRRQRNDWLETRLAGLSLAERAALEAAVPALAALTDAQMPDAQMPDANTPGAKP